MWSDHKLWWSKIGRFQHYALQVGTGIRFCQVHRHGLSGADTRYKTAVPVSYTHLDVYKRQTSRNVANKSRLRLLLRSLIMIRKNCRKVWPSWDVYKRQGKTSAMQTSRTAFASFCPFYAVAACRTFMVSVMFYGIVYISQYVLYFW